MSFSYPLNLQKRFCTGAHFPPALFSVVHNHKGKDEYQREFAESYFHLIISDEGYAKQLWSLGNAYVCQKKKGCERELISSMTIFQSRGSITATQGHIPETILREYMKEWGLKENEDFNTSDVEAVSYTHLTLPTT